MCTCTVHVYTCTTCTTYIYVCTLHVVHVHVVHMYVVHVPHMYHGYVCILYTVHVLYMTVTCYTFSSSNHMNCEKVKTLLAEDKKSQQFI